MQPRTNEPAVLESSPSGYQLSRRWWALAACCLAACAKALEPPIWIFNEPVVEAFGAGWARYSLFVSVLTLGTLAFLLLGGVLGDIFGRRRLLLVGLASLTAANLLRVLSPDPTWILGTRMLSGAAGALILPLSLTMLYLSFPEDVPARTTAIAIYVALISTASLVAGVLGQLMQTLLDWRATSILPMLCAVSAWLLIWRTTAESRVGAGQRIDVVGHAAWSLTVFGVLFGVLVSQVAGPYSLSMLLASISTVVFGIAVLVWWEFRTSDTLFGRSNIPRHALLVLIVYGVCLQIGFVGYIGLVRNVLIAVYDYGALRAGIALVPMLLGMGLMTLYGTRSLGDVRAYIVMSGSLLIIGALTAVTVLTRAVAFYPWLGLLLAVLGGANVAASTAWTSVFFSLVPKDALGIRSGINSSVSQAGGALGVALTSSLLLSVGIANYRLILVAAGAEPTQIERALAALNTILDPATPDPDLDPSIRARLIAGYQLAYLSANDRVLLFVALICLVGALVAWFGLPHRERATAVSK
jgi:MFS family permease